jgi:uncharacterized protein (DUF2147 family)
MAKAATVLMLTLLMSAAAGAALAAPSPDGVWQTVSDKDGKPEALIRIETVGGALQGVIVSALRGDSVRRVCDKCPGDRRGKPIVGMQIMWGLKPDPGDPLRYGGGRILDPNSGNIYGADLTEGGDGRTLMVHGFLGLSFLGRTQTWRRAQ